MKQQYTLSKKGIVVKKVCHLFAGAYNFFLYIEIGFVEQKKIVS